MRSAHTNRIPADALSADVFAVQDVEVEGFYYPDGLTESAIDALIASVDRELAATETAAEVRTTHSYTDARSATRTSRRAGRSVLRSLPVRLDTTTATVDGQAA